jgi:predicted transposase YdaD
LSGVFSVENAGESWEALQRAVDRIAAIVQADPNKERIDRIVTRWLKRHLHRLGAEVNLDRINSLVEDKAMLAENIENLLKKERLEARQEGRLEGRQEGCQEEAQKILRKQISLKFGDLPTWAQQRLEQATPDQLEDWSAAILVADSLESLLGEH